jgi:hypothetical protein
MNVSNHHLAGRVVIVTGAGSGIPDRPCYRDCLRPGRSARSRRRAPRGQLAPNRPCTSPDHGVRCRHLRRRHARDRHQRGDCRWERVDVLVTIAGATATTGPGCRCDNVSTPCRPATPGDAYRSVWPRGPSKSTTGQGLSLATIGRSDVTSRSWRGCCRLPRRCRFQDSAGNVTPLCCGFFGFHLILATSFSIRDWQNCNHTAVPDRVMTIARVRGLQLPAAPCLRPATNAWLEDTRVMIVDEINCCEMLTASGVFRESWSMDASTCLGHCSRRGNLLRPGLTLN